MSEEEYNEYIDELRVHGTRELAEEVYRLEQENKELKETINKSKEYITNDVRFVNIQEYHKLLEILESVNK